MLKTRHIIRAILQSVAASQGYTVSGNHVFDARSMARIDRNQYAQAVIESPSDHPHRMVRTARLLSLTY